jgi:hypothetical protein
LRSLREAASMNKRRMDKPVGQRRESRTAQSQKVFFYKERRPEEGQQLGVILNASSSGFCMHVMQDLEPGEILHATLEGAHDVTCLIVRWTKALAERLFWVGVEKCGE